MRRSSAERGLSDVVRPDAASRRTRVRGTLRGLHYQTAPHEEAKLVRCTAGTIFDVAVDLRPGSPTFRSWIGRRALVRSNRLALYVPEGCAHGFLTLTDDCEVLVPDVGAARGAESGRGVRFDDPAFGIEWPCEVVVINERDRTYPDFSDSEAAVG